MSSAELALAILGAYSHDLAMTVAENESDDFDPARNPAYQALLDLYPVEQTAIGELEARGERDAASAIRRFLQTEYIRKTHAEPPATRLKARIDAITEGRLECAGGRRDSDPDPCSHRQRERPWRICGEDHWTGRGSAMTRGGHGASAV